VVKSDRLLDPNLELAVDRRTFLMGLGAAPAALDFPWQLSRARPAEDRALVVLELVGGNDGLNTLIPLGDDAYAKARPTLGEVRRGAHDVGGGFGLHPSLERTARRVVEGTAAIVHGVGYARPNRSHFQSRDIWHAADPSLRRVAADTTGWVGRVADQLTAAGRSARDSASGVPALRVGNGPVPLLVRGRRAQVPSIEGVEAEPVVVDEAGGMGDARRAALEARIRSLGTDAADGAEGALARAAQAALEQAARLREGARRYRAGAEYPDHALGRHLQTVARVRTSGMGCRVFHVEHGGFDTHARQLPSHAGLLRQLDGALAAFFEDLAAHGAADRTTVLVHSEFGRRVAENRSLGTDHGAAAPVLVLGGGVAPGLHGVAPSLTELDDGDLVMTCDFRRVLAACVGWVGADVSCLGEGFDGPLPLWSR